jgi:hypothetical protein
LPIASVDFPFASSRHSACLSTKARFGKYTAEMENDKAVA